VSSAIVPVLTVRTRTRVARSPALTKPRSIAKGATPARMLPQFGVVSTIGLSTPTWQNRKSMSQAGSFERETIATLLVSGCAPPMPSTCRASGEPSSARSV
jgi:hypothetical protein